LSKTFLALSESVFASFQNLPVFSSFSLSDFHVTSINYNFAELWNKGIEPQNLLTK